ncbi:MAG: hypothetical protein EOO08_07885, partial [Chitinophagaceae bacterium]
MRATLPATALLLLLAGSSALAQQEAPLHFQRVGGLPQNTAYAITRDHKGFVWVATGNGLARFDGQSMQAFPGYNSPTTPLQGRIIRSDLLEDGQGSLWFSTEKSVHRLSLQTTRVQPESLPTGEGSRAGFASPVLRTSNELWLCSPTEGLYRIDLRTGTKSHYPVTVADSQGLPIPLMYNGTYDGRRSLWFASSKGLLSFNLNTRKWMRIAGQHKCYTVAFARDTLFLGEGTEASWLEPATGHHGILEIHGIARQKRALLRRIYTDPSGNLWAGDEKGNVFCRRSSSSAFHWRGNINGNEAPRTNYPVYCFFADSTGTLWVGAYMLGLLKAVTGEPAFRRIGQDGPQDFFVNSIYEDSSGGIWMGTYENGLLHSDRGGATIPIELPYRGPRLPYGNSVPLVTADRRGTLWTSRSGRLFYRRRGGTFFQSILFPQPQESLQVPQLWTFSEANEGCLLGTNIGLYWLRDSGGIPALRHLSWLGQHRVSATWIAPSGKAWVAFESGGVQVLQETTRFKTGTMLFPGTQVRAFWNDSTRALLWMAGTDGLIALHLRSGLHRIYTEKEGLPARYLLSLTGSRGELWLASPGGLARGTPTFRNGVSFPELSFTTFTDADGVDGDQFNPGAAYT